MAREAHASIVRVEGRNEAMTTVVADTLERDFELLGLTGVEDKLQDDVRERLELLRRVEIKISCAPLASMTRRAEKDITDVGGYVVATSCQLHTSR